MVRKDDEKAITESKEVLDILEHVHAKVEPIIAKANEIFVSGFSSNSTISWKEGVQLSTAVLTGTDSKLDQFLREQFSVTFPEMGIITEEQELVQQQEYTWILDPLDASANFANRIPICGMSVALWRKNKPIYGLLSFPLEGETVHAVSGKGAFLNGERIAFQNLEIPPHLGTLFTGVGTEVDKLKAVNKMSRVVPFPNNFQCATFHFKTLALRRADCGVFINMPIWDIAAGILITKEAGLTNIFITNESPAKSANLRETRYTIVIGQEEIASKVAEQLKA